MIYPLEDLGSMILAILLSTPKGDEVAASTAIVELIRQDREAHEQSKL